VLGRKGGTSGQKLFPIVAAVISVDAAQQSLRKRISSLLIDNCDGSGKPERRLIPFEDAMQDVLQRLYGFIFSTEACRPVPSPAPCHRDRARTSA
jgi:hypothetical protein